MSYLKMIVFISVFLSIFIYINIDIKGIKDLGVACPVQIKTVVVADMGFLWNFDGAEMRRGMRGWVLLLDVQGAYKN